VRLKRLISEREPKYCGSDKVSREGKELSLLGPVKNPYPALVFAEVSFISSLDSRQQLVQVIDEIAYLARVDMNLRTASHSTRGMVPSER
jgi:hypothetical protein